MNNRKYNKEWSLFLDRDGVINKEIPGTYVTEWSGFSFYEGALPALVNLSHTFGNLFVVTNQRGVGRGIMTIEDLRNIHREMRAVIEENGGRLNRIYACTSVDDNDQNRKPNTGMGLQAKEDFPDLEFSKSVMVGNNLSDMLFGRRLGMRTVFIATTQDPLPMPHDMIDEQFSSLKEWADSLSIAADPVLN